MHAPLLDATFLETVFRRGAEFDSYLESDLGRSPDWREVYRRTMLDDAQRALVGSFTRTMHVLVVSGTWCGDCVQQGPMLERIAEAWHHWSAHEDGYFVVVHGEIIAVK